MSNDALIVHQYAFSPFGEKVRAMLGCADLAWQAVEVPPQPPRPSLTPMITGYRKSPVAQIGADVFCDTATIATEIARLSGNDAFSPAGRSQADRDYLDHLEGPIFAACLGALPRGKVLVKLVTSLGFGLPKFLKDRAALGAAGGLDLLPAAEATKIWNDHLDQLDGKVAGGFLGGAAPDLLDFAAYHVVWFYELMSDTKPAAGRASLLRWQSDMAALGHGRPEPIDGDRAVAVARESEPRELPESTDDPDLGKTVRIAPTDYGRDDTEGTLVAATKDRWIIARDTQTCGRIHAHFPTHRFQKMGTGTIS